MAEQHVIVLYPSQISNWELVCLIMSHGCYRIVAIAEIPTKEIAHE